MGYPPQGYPAAVGDNEVYGLLLSGTIAARPAAGIVDRYYWATDEHVLYHDTGAAWEKVAVADHLDLDGVTADQHHTKLHHVDHEAGGGDPLAAPVALAAIPELLIGKVAPVAMTEPPSPVLGQPWYDAGVPALKVCTAAGSDEQLRSDRNENLYSERPRMGQRKTLSNAYVTKLGFKIKKMLGSPTGDVTLTVRRVSDDGIILSKVWGDAADVPSEDTYVEVEFDTPVTVNEEVRLCVEFYGGEFLQYLTVRAQDGNVKADEYFSSYSTFWEDFELMDIYYKLTMSAQWSVV